MAAEQVLNLLDTFWFETTIFTNKTPSPFHTHVVEQVLPLDTKLLRVPTLQVRSFSDQNLGSTLGDFSDSPSPNSVLTPQKLQTILSEKEVEQFHWENNVTGNNEVEEDEVVHKMKRQTHGHRRKLRNGKSTRSLSDLEFKELKGFMDLGFMFSEEDKDSRLVSLIPGLQRLGIKDGSTSVSAEHKQNNDDETVICRPYLSEAWGVLDQRKNVNLLMLNWRVPALGNEVDMKENLRFWAHTVASIVR